jgi:hypothetical protein
MPVTSSAFSLSVWSISGSPFYPQTFLHPCSYRARIEQSEKSSERGWCDRSIMFKALVDPPFDRLLDLLFFFFKLTCDHNDGSAAAVVVVVLLRSRDDARSRGKEE